MTYSWRSATGLGPGTNTQEGPPEISFPVSTNALTKSLTDEYNPSNQTIGWSLNVNPHKVAMSASDSISIIDTLGVNHQMYYNGTDTSQWVTGFNSVNEGTLNIFSISDSELTTHSEARALISSIFGINDTNVNTYVNGFEYRKEIGGEYAFTLNFKSALSKNELLLKYKTKVTDAAAIATNQSTKEFSNSAVLSYKNISNDYSSNDSEKAVVSSTVLTKTGVGYDYKKEEILRKIEANKNKMVLEDNTHRAYITDVIENDQTLPTNQTIKISMTDTSGGKTSYTINSVETSSPSYTNNPTAWYYLDSANGSKPTLEIDFGDAENINEKMVTIEFVTKVANSDITFNAGKALDASVANTACLHSIYNDVTENATVKIYNKFIKKFATRGSNGNSDPIINYAVGINPLHVTLEDGFTIVDTLPYGLSLDTSSFALYETDVKNTRGENGTTENNTINADTRALVNTSDGTQNLLSNGTLTFEKVTKIVGGKNVQVTQFKYVFHFEKSVWGSDAVARAAAKKKTYVLKYKGLVTDVTQTTFTNQVEVENIGYSSMSDHTDSSYYYGNGSIYAMAGNTYGRITITKVNSANPAETLNGAEFMVEQLDSVGNTLQAIHLKTSGSGSGAGKAIFRYLIPGATYRITEVSAPLGFSSVGLPKVIDTVTLGNATELSRYYSLTVSNDPGSYQVSFAKLDQYGRVVQGAEFAVYNATDDDTDPSKIIDQTTSDASGRVTFALQSTTKKNYKLKELSAPAGYTFDAATAPLYYFSIDEHGNFSGLYTGFDAATSILSGTLVTSVINQSENPPVDPPKPNNPSDSNTPSDPGTPSEPYDPDVNIVWESDKPKPTTYSPEALSAWQEAYDEWLRGVLGEKLPKTGGFVGSALLFMLGASMVGGGVYLNKKGKKHDEEETGRD